jgi:predicted dehydrogenase
VTRVLVVGLGTIARTHLAVLSRLPSVDAVAGVDPAPTYDVPVPVHATLDEGLALRPDLVVLSTPTQSHVGLADVLLSSSSAVVLSEKPLAQSAAEIAGLESRHSPEVVADRLKVAHHFAFSPEVEWAARLVAGHPEWGQPTRVVAM